MVLNASALLTQVELQVPHLQGLQLCDASAAAPPDGGPARSDNDAGARVHTRAEQDTPSTSTSNTGLLDLPVDLLLHLLLDAPWAARLACRAFARALPTGRVALRLRQPRAALSCCPRLSGGGNGEECDTTPSSCPPSSGGAACELGRLLAQVPHLRCLCGDETQRLTSLRGLACAAPSLRALHLDGCCDVASLAPLSACPALRVVMLARCGPISDLRPLSACADLRLLSLSSRAITDISPLAACTALSALYLDGCCAIADLTPLSACAGLSVLTLRGCESVTDLGPLAACSKLREVDLSGCKGLRTVAALAACLSLVHLNLNSCDFQVDVSSWPAAARGLRVTGLC